jgi:hypothetical protein
MRLGRGVAAVERRAGAAHDVGPTGNSNQGAFMQALLRFLVAAGALCGGAAFAAEPSGCDKFKWPIDKAQAALAAAQPLAPGATLAIDAAARVKLVPFAEAKLALAPERPPKFSPSYAGAFALAAPTAAGVYTATISANGWLDLVQDGKFLKQVGFSAATDCPNVRKAVKFRLTAAPTMLQVTGVGVDEISVIVSPQ